MLTISEIKNILPDSKDVPLNPSVKANVLEVGEIEPANGRMKAKFFCILADETGSISCTVYKESEKSKFVQGMAVLLCNVMIKQSYVAVTERTQVAICRGFSIPEEVKTHAPKLPGEPEMDISMVLHSPVKTLTGVKGKVIRVEEPTTKDYENEILDFQDIYIKDKKEKVCVALWDNLAGIVKVGQLVQITKCKVKLFNGEKKLSTTLSSKLQMIGHDEDLDGISSEDENQNYDDIAATPSSSELEHGLISAVFEMDPYLACPLKGCNNSKLITIEVDGKYKMKCKLCKGEFTASSCNSYLRGSVFFERVGYAGKKVGIFLPQIKKLFEARGVNWEMSFDRDELVNNFCNLVPIQVGVKIMNNTIREIVPKRDAI